MRILGPLLLSQALLMSSRQSHLRLGRAVRAQFVGHQHIGREALFLEQLAHQFYGWSVVAPSLHQETESLAFIVTGTRTPRRLWRRDRPMRRARSGSASRTGAGP